MAGVAGRSGRKEGSLNNKPWREALELAVNEIDPVTKQKKLRRVAQKVVDIAMAGDMTAAKEIGDRLDGKPRQETELTGTEGGPILFEEVRRVIVDTANSNPEGVRPVIEGGSV